MLCKQCQQREKTYNSLCKVCNYKKRNQDKIDGILKTAIWTEEEIDILLENILYSKIDVINDLENILATKSLKQIVDLIIEMHIGGRIPIRIKLNCFSCGQELIRPIGHFYKDRVYCSYECRDKYKTNYLSGENSPFYNRINTICTNCGKKIDVIPFEYNLHNEYGDHHNFCSTECYYEYRSNYYVGDKHPMFGTHLTDEQKKNASERVITMIASGKMPQTMTKPHKKIYELLISNGVKCKNEYVLKYHSIDIYLEQYNLMIEIMGDYWHGIPLKYTYDQLNKQQLKSIKQDKSKYTYTKKYHNIEILYLWECDINHNIDLCWNLIQEYIRNDGLLKNYNSYNYELIDNLLVLKDEIILPYFITQNPYRLQEVDGNTNLEVVLPTPLLEGNNIQSVLTL